MRNLKSDVSEEQLKEKFEPYGKIERVKKIKDYGFVHFEDREDALKAMEELNGTVSNTQKCLNTTHVQEIGCVRFGKQKEPRSPAAGREGKITLVNCAMNMFLSLQRVGESEMDISLAKPPSEKKKMEKRRR